MGFLCREVAHFTVARAFEVFFLGNGVLFGIGDASNAADRVGVSLADAAAPEGVIFTMRQSGFAQKTHQREETRIPTHRNERYFARRFGDAIHAGEVFFNFGVGVKAVDDVEVATDFQPLFHEIVGGAAAKDHHIDFILKRGNLIHREDRRAACRSDTRTAGKNSDEFHVVGGLQRDFRAARDIAVTDDADASSGCCHNHSILSYESMMYM